MTVIAWDGKTLAADRMCVRNGSGFESCKLFRIGPEVAAVCGDQDSGRDMLMWYQSGADPDKFPAAQQSENRWARLVVARASGLVTYERSPLELPVLEKYAAFGSGGDIALGALAHGADAITAVKIASAHDVNCGKGYDSAEPT